MIFKSNLDLIYLLNFDIFSKYNLFNNGFFFSINKLEIFVKLDIKETSFLTNFFNLSKIFFFWFNSKISILNFFKNTEKIRNNSIFFICGFSLTNIFKVFSFVDFFFNIIFFISKNIDNSIKFKYDFFSYNFFFSNINYILGLDTSKLYSWNKNFFLLIKFKHFFVKQKHLEKNIIGLYEKLFL